MKHAPVTIAIVGASALALLAPQALELDRDLTHQAWRWLTGHLSHGGLAHWLVDAATLLVLGLLYERRVGSARWAAGLFAAAIVISAGFLLFEHLRAYRGLSGVDCAAFAMAIRAEWTRSRRFAFVMAILFIGKLVYEQSAGAFIFPALAAPGAMGEPVLSAHLLGGLVGLAISARAPGLHGPCRNATVTPYVHPTGSRDPDTGHHAAWCGHAPLPAQRIDIDRQYADLRLDRRE